MSTVESTSVPEELSSTDTDEPTPDMDSIGIELEYPIARTPDMIPAGTAGNSSSAREHFRSVESNSWFEGRFGGEGGYVGRDHTGAEITSGVLDLHSSQPDDWYHDSIEAVEAEGYPFAASGAGSTNFGLHMHVSEINEDQRNFIRDVCGNEWARVFFCASVDRGSADPWRHGGVRSVSQPWRGPRNPGPNHWEFRLPEPGLPEHVSLMVEFLRLVSYERFEEAREFARELVYDRDERLTPVAQYRQLSEEYDSWPDEDAMDGTGRTTPAAAEWFVDLMNE